MKNKKLLCFIFVFFCQDLFPSIFEQFTFFVKHSRSRPAPLLLDMVYETFNHGTVREMDFVCF